MGSLSNSVQYFLMAGAYMVGHTYNPLMFGMISAGLSFTSLILMSTIQNFEPCLITVFVAVEQSCLVSSSFTILPDYFDDKLAFAYGVINSFGCLIGFIMTLTTWFIISNYGLSQALIFINWVNLMGAVMTMAFQVKSNSSDAKRTISHASIWNFFHSNEIFKGLKFKVFCLASGIASFGYFVPIINMVILNIIRDLH